MTIEYNKVLIADVSMLIEGKLVDWREYYIFTYYMEGKNYLKNYLKMLSHAPFKLSSLRYYEK